MSDTSLAPLLPPIHVVLAPTVCAIKSHGSATARINRVLVVQVLVRHLVLVQVLARHLVLVQVLVRHLVLVQVLVRHLVLVQVLARHLVLVQVLARHLVQRTSVNLFVNLTPTA